MQVHRFIVEIDDDDNEGAGVTHRHLEHVLERNVSATASVQYVDTREEN